MAGHHSQVVSLAVSSAASSYLVAATRQSLAAYALLPSLNAFMARTWFKYPQPASVTLSPINSARYAAEDRLFIENLPVWTPLQTRKLGSISAFSWGLQPAFAKATAGKARSPNRSLPPWLLRHRSQGFGRQTDRE